MHFNFKGHLCGGLCDDCFENIFPARIRIYSLKTNNRVVAQAVANPKETLKVLKDDEIKQKSQMLLAEGSTDENGNFELSLDSEKTKYDGGPVEIDVYLETVPYKKSSRKKSVPVQVSITTLQPAWRESENGYYTGWEYCIPTRFWCMIRQLFDAWVICGIILDCKSQKPVSGVTVSAFDSDWITDDPLGSAVTDGGGHFRIDYTSAAFKRTFLSPIINVETPLFDSSSGPDIYFKVTSGSTTLLNEAPSRGLQRDREDRGPCFCVSLCIDVGPQLECQLTQPHDCAHGSSEIIPGRLLELVQGTARGFGFSHYILELTHGSNLISGAIIYSDLSGNPDLGLVQGNHEVTSGTLGFIDLQAAATAVGAALLTSTLFDLRLRVISTSGIEETCTLTFDLAISKSMIKSVGASIALDALQSATPLVANGTITPEVSIGGGVFIKGSADVFGCDMEKISQVNVYAIPGHTSTQPANGSTFSLPAGGIIISQVEFSNDDQRGANPLSGTSTFGNILTYENGWFTRTEWIIVGGLPFPVIVPDIVEKYWSAETGKYTLLLEVKDNTVPTPRTFFDIQRVWVDNESIRAKITQIGSVSACGDLFLKASQPSIDIRGMAWDRFINEADPDIRPNNNFRQYSLSFKKNGSASYTAIPVAVATQRKPNTSTDPIPTNTDDVLTTWDVASALDGSGINQLARGSRCAYIIRLEVTDTTLVGEGGSNHYAAFDYAINIINDL